VQRRHQKVLEEAPAPGMTQERRRAMGEAAVAAARAIGYVGAGTVEFIVEGGRFYFMEMNTRLQVEHPVTEMITGLDLVEWQLRVARGEPLPLAQDDVRVDGHAIEARLYAEDPARGFLPSTGAIDHWAMPAAAAGVRVDTGFRAGDTVSPYYDPMLAKVIVHAGDRATALARMHAALAQCEVVGVATNVEFLGRVVTLPAFAAGDLDTGLIERHRDALFAPPPDAGIACIVAAAAEWQRPCATTFDADTHSPWNARDAWWPNSAKRRIVCEFDDAGARQRVELTLRDDRRARARIGDRTAAIAVADVAGERIAVDVDGVRRVATVVARDRERHVFVDGAHRVLVVPDPLAVGGDADDGGGHLRAPMSGTIVAVMAKAGDAVAKSAPLVVLEAMKMEHTIVAPHAGTVSAVNCRVGERVAEGADLVDLDAAAG
jgi:3-methylcrotonyl-CoA carboxylase alpha subunit